MIKGMQTSARQELSQMAEAKMLKEHLFIMQTV